MMLAMSFGEKDSEKHARNPCNVTNQNIINYYMYKYHRLSLLLEVLSFDN